MFVYAVTNNVNCDWKYLVLAFRYVASTPNLKGGKPNKHINDCQEPAIISDSVQMYIYNCLS